MSEEPNVFQRYDYYTTLIDDKGRPQEVKLTDLSEEDFRRWLLWKRPRLVHRGPREAPPAAKPKKKKEKQSLESTAKGDKE